MELIRESLVKSWQALNRNWIVVWFPTLVGLGIGILLILVVAMTFLGFGGMDILQGHVPVEQIMGRMLMMLIAVGFIAMLLGNVVISGQANLMRIASEGGVATTADFGVGVRRFYGRILLGGLVLGIGALVFGLIFFGGLVSQLGLLIMQLEYAGPDYVLPFILQTMPSVLAGVLFFVIVNFFLGIWKEILVIDDIGTFPALLASVKVVWSRFGVFLVLAIGNGVITSIINRLGSGGLMGLLSGLLVLIWTVYMQLVFYTLYQFIKIGGPPQSQTKPEDDPNPPHLIV